MKTILLTGATDGIGLETARILAREGHRLLLHGRNKAKLEQLQKELSLVNESIEGYLADFSDLEQVSKMAEEILSKVDHIDVLINNAGIFVTEANQLVTVDGLDVRFAVNTIAPYQLTKMLMKILGKESRVINLASAAQAPVDIQALEGKRKLSHSEAYAQSKLAIIMWSMELAEQHPKGPSFIPVNPKSFLGSKMVKEAYGQEGYDLKIGADILYRAALSDEFKDVSGRYFDNDYGKFGAPHPFALKSENRDVLMKSLDGLSIGF